MLGPSHGAANLVSGAQPASHVGAAKAKGSAWGEDGFTFGDLIDVVNPLQHIPIVSWAYRALSGDKIAPAAKMMGGALFGGTVGFALGTADAAFQATTGTDAGGTVVAMLTGRKGATAPRGDAPATAVAIADNARRQPQPTPAQAQADAATLTLSEQQLARLMDGFGRTPAPATAAPAMVPPWQEAAAALPPEQVALLMQSVGLPAAKAEPRAPAVTVAPAGTVRVNAPAMPALPAQAIFIAELPPPDGAAADTRAATAAAARQRALDQAVAAGDELRRLYAAP
ncbi:MAG: hypothetical protein FJX64_03010 [Alphaproteobacteria bacterium]|nr:hypothetical protein [Alphaproteobacteria bacterium]